MLLKIIYFKNIMFLRKSVNRYFGLVWEPGQLVGKSVGLVIERLRVRIPAGAAGEFSSPELTLCADSYHSGTVARERLRSFCQKCRWQATPKHACTFETTKSEWADFAAVQAQYWNLSGNELSRNLSGNIRPQSSQLSEPLWTDPGINSGISVREIISTSKKKKNAQAENDWSNISQNPLKQGKSHHFDHILMVKAVRYTFQLSFRSFKNKTFRNRLTSPRSQLPRLFACFNAHLYLA